MVIDPISQPHFHFIRVIVGLGISEVVGLVIDKAIMTGVKITISFYRLLLW